MDVPALVERYLLGWVLAAVAVSALVPGVAAVTRFSTPILMVMVGSVSLTLTLGDFREVDPRGLGVVLAGHVAMPALAFTIARALGLSPALTAGFVLLGAVTPELVTPTMTDLAGGDVALASSGLVTIGVASLAFLPAVVTLFLGDAVAIDAWRVVRELLVAVVAPMAAAVAVRTRYDEPIARYREWYSAVSALMVVLIIGGVTAANAPLLRTQAALLPAVGVGVLALNLAGYALGWIGGRFLDRPARIGAALSVGMRDFAVAAGLVVAAGFPAGAAVPAVLFGILEMVTSTGLARRFAREQ